MPVNLSDDRPTFPEGRFVPSFFILRATERGGHGTLADIVAILDADCIPGPDWLRHLMDTMRNHPNVVAVSGRTVYTAGSLTERVLALLSRPYPDPVCTGRTSFISNNNAGFRRSVFLTHPLPTDAGPFAARLQSEAILRSGGRLLFEPRMRVVHDSAGRAMEGTFDATSATAGLLCDCATARCLTPGWLGLCFNPAVRRGQDSLLPRGSRAPHVNPRDHQRLPGTEKQEITEPPTVGRRDLGCCGFDQWKPLSRRMG